MLTSVPLRYAVVFAFLVITGAFMGDIVFLYSAALVLVYLYVNFDVTQPEGIKIVRLHHDAELDVDDLFTFQYRISVEKGVGFITVGFDVPEHFKLAEGNNLTILWKGKEPLEKTVRFTVRCEKRGTHRTSGANWETRHPLGFKSTRQGRVDAPTVITVYPKHYHIRRIRDRKIYSNMPVPTEALIQIGVPTTSFKDIREYQIGDPFRSINWKATARRTYHQYQPPMVNEYEKEGRKTVWIFMNTASRMLMGNSIHNCFEYAIQAVIELADFYLDRNCLLGFTAFNDDFPAGSIGFLYKGGRYFLPGVSGDTSEATRYVEIKSFLPPDAGTQQSAKLRRMLNEITPSSLFPSLREAIKQARSQIRGSTPLFIILTTIDKQHSTELSEALKEINQGSSSRVSQPKGLLVHLMGYELLDAPIQASRLRYLEDIRQLNDYLESAELIKWNPVRGLLNEAMMAQVNK